MLQVGGLNEIGSNELRINEWNEIRNRIRGRDLLRLLRLQSHLRVLETLLHRMLIVLKPILQLSLQPVVVVAGDGRLVRKVAKQVVAACNCVVIFHSCIRGRQCWLVHLTFRLEVLV